MCKLSLVVVLVHLTSIEHGSSHVLTDASVSNTIALHLILTTLKLSTVVCVNVSLFCKLTLNLSVVLYLVI